MSKLTQKIATVSIAIATIATLSGPVFAQSVDLQAQIAALLAQIQTLQAQLGQQSASTSAYNFAKNLTLGSTGADVKALQGVLISKGFLKLSAPTTTFGPMTKAALSAWQAAEGISPAVGYFGAISRAKMNSMSGTVTPGTGTTPVVTVPSGTDLVVSLASDNPSARTIGSGTAFNPAMKVAFTAGSKAVKISAIKIMKSGFVANTNLNGVDIVDSKGVRHGNVVTSVNADNSIIVTMSSDPVMVAAGSSETLTVRFNLVTGDYSGTVSFSINDIASITADTTSISGAFPIYGTAMSIVNGGSSLSTITLDVLTSTGSSTLNVDPANSQEITKFRVQETSSNEGVYLRKLALYNYGNAAASDLSDVQLIAQDGTILSTGLVSDKNVTFNLASPYFIDKGQTKDFTVKAKIVNGTTKTINFVVYNNYDIDLYGAATNVSVIPGVGSNDTAFPIGNGFNIQTIGSGSMTLTRASDSPSSAVTPGTTNVVLAKFNAKPTGENFELRQVSFYVASSSGSTALTGTIYVKINGAIVYSTAATNISYASASTFTLSSYTVLTAGVDSAITIEGSINSSAVAASSYTVTNFDLIQAKRLVTNDLVDPGTGVVSGLSIAVKAAALAVTTLSTPVANSVVAGTNGYEYADFQLNAQSGGEDVKVSKIVVTHSGGAVGEVANLSMYKDSDTSPLVTSGSTATNAATVTFNFSTPILVTKATPVTLRLKADAVSGTGSHTFSIASSTSALTAVGSVTGNSLTNGTDITYAGGGQAMAHVAAGNLILSVVSGSTASPSQNQVMQVGTSGATLFAFKLTSQYEAQKVTSLKITATTTAANSVATTTLNNIALYEGAATTPFATAPQFDTCDASKCQVTFTSSDNLLSAAVPTTGVTIYVKANVAAGGSAQLGDSFKFQIASTTGDIAIKGAVTASTAGTKTGSAAASGATYVTPASVSISAVSPTSAATIGLSAGQTVGIFKITNNGSAPIYLSSSTLSLANGGSATNSVSFGLYSSIMGGTQSDASVTYIATSTATGASSTIPFDLTLVTSANRKIDGGSWRYFTVKTTGTALNNDTFGLAVSALGNVLYSVDEADLGFSGNPVTDNDLSDTIINLYVDGTPSLSTVTAKT
ncbi:MAG: peptidoglycan-binding protein [Candidatus Paceibacterota bacterium]